MHEYLFIYLFLLHGFNLTLINFVTWVLKINRVFFISLIPNYQVKAFLNLQLTTMSVHPFILNFTTQPRHQLSSSLFFFFL